MFCLIFYIDIKYVLDHVTCSVAHVLYCDSRPKAYVFVYVYFRCNHFWINEKYTYISMVP